MSAFMLDDEHFVFLARAAHALGLADDPAALANELKAWNARAVANRYDDPLEEALVDPGVSIDDLAGLIEHPSFVHKQARCFRYQACDDPAYDDSDVGLLIERLLERLGLSPLEADAAMGDDGIPWGIWAGDRGEVLA